MGSSTGLLMPPPSLESGGVRGLLVAAPKALLVTREITGSGASRERAWSPKCRQDKEPTKCVL